MGGYFSGRKGWRRKVESQHSVDIRWMKRKGWLYNGCTGTLTWSCRGEQTGSIGYWVSAETITLDYKHHEPDGEWEPVQSEIRLEYTACNYGGKRIWMRCPHCGRRCAKVYIAGKYPACRKCYNLAYNSEAETEIDRSMRRARTAQEKLGYHDGNLSAWIPKPKGMHWSTYEQHMKTINQANDFFAHEMMRRFNIRA